jgi:hypothetical protein
VCVELLDLSFVFFYFLNYASNLRKDVIDYLTELLDKGAPVNLLTDIRVDVSQQKGTP